jgi:hypothetical protein
MLRSRWLPDAADLHRADRPAGGAVRSGLLLALVLIACGALGVAGFTWPGGFLREGAAVPVIALTGLALVLITPALEAISGKLDRGRRMLAVALTLWACAGGLGWIAGEVLDHPLVHRGFCNQWLCNEASGGARERFTWGYLMGCTAALSIAAVVAGRMTARVLASAALRPVCLGVLRAAAIAALFLGSGLVALSVAARARRPNPSLSAYVDTLPTLAMLPAPWSSMGYMGRPWTEVAEGDDKGCMTARAGALELWDCFGSFGLSRGGAVQTRPRGGEGGRVRLGGGDRSIVVRLDAARRVVFVELWPEPSPTVGERAAFSTDTLQPLDLRLVELADLTGPPRVWIVAAAVGLFLALGILLGARPPPLERDEAAELALLHRHALALALVALPAAPLVAAALRGLVPTL